jgi:hypothetical protein
MDDFRCAGETTSKLTVGVAQARSLYGASDRRGRRDRFIAASADAAASGSIVLGGAPLSGDPFDRQALRRTDRCPWTEAQSPDQPRQLFVPFLSVLPLDDRAVILVGEEARHRLVFHASQLEERVHALDARISPIKFRTLVSDDRRLARLPDLLRMEGVGHIGQGRAGKLVRPAVHA